MSSYAGSQAESTSVASYLLSRYRGTLVRLTAILLALIAWELYTTTQPAYLFPSLGAIYEAFVEQVADDDLAHAFARSMFTLLVGFVIAAVVGICLGLAMGINDRVGMVLNPYVNALYVAPISAVVPILLFVGGSTFGTRVAVVFLFVVFEVVIDTYEGVKSTPDGLIEASQSYDAGQYFILRHVILPNDLPYIFAGLRLGIGRGVKGLILAELLIEFANLGAIIRTWEASFRIAGVLSVVALLMVTGILLVGLMQRIGDWMMPWKKEVNV